MHAFVRSPCAFRAAVCAAIAVAAPLAQASETADAHRNDPRRTGLRADRVAGRRETRARRRLGVVPDRRALVGRTGRVRCGHRPARRPVRRRRRVAARVGVAMGLGPRRQPVRRRRWRCRGAGRQRADAARRTRAVTRPRPAARGAHVVARALSERRHPKLAVGRAVVVATAVPLLRCRCGGPAPAGGRHHRPGVSPHRRHHRHVLACAAATRGASAPWAAAPNGRQDPTGCSPASTPLRRHPAALPATWRFSAPLGWRITPWSALPQLSFEARGSLGLGGGGAVPTEGGAIGKLLAGASYDWGQGWRTGIEAGVLRGIGSPLRARVAQLWVAMDLEPAAEAPGSGTISRNEWSVTLQRQARAQRNDGSTRALDTIGMKLNRYVDDHIYLSAQAHSAFAGGAGAYSIGLIGAGASTRPAAGLRYRRRTAAGRGRRRRRGVGRRRDCAGTGLGRPAGDARFGTAARASARSSRCAAARCAARCWNSHGPRRSAWAAIERGSWCWLFIDHLVKFNH